LFEVVGLLGRGKTTWRESRRINKAVGKAERGLAYMNLI